MAAYAGAKLWELRAQAPADVEWYCTHRLLRPLYEHVLNDKKANVLLLGTGTSTMPEMMYDSGFRRLACLDLAPTAARIAACKQSQRQRPGLHFLQGDVRDGGLKQLSHRQPGQTDHVIHTSANERTAVEKAEEAPLQAELSEDHQSFALVVDKGVLDCVMCDSFCLREGGRMVTAVWEALSSQGMWICVSHSPPVDRMHVFNGVKSCGWSDIQVRMCQRDIDPDKLGQQPADEQLLGMLDTDYSNDFSIATSYVYCLKK